MRKLFLYGAAFCAVAFALASCQNDVVSPESPDAGYGGFEIMASVPQPESKTVNDGIHTKWAAGDWIAVFHTDGTLVKDGMFTITDPVSNKFSGNVATAPDPAFTYAWYAFYSSNPSISGPDEAWLYIGGNHTQDGYDNTSHLAGTALPLYGEVADVKGDAMPSIPMKHASGVLKLSVKNELAEAVIINSVTFYTDASMISGSFGVDITSDEVVYIDGNDTYNEASVNISNATELEAGKTAVIYIPMKPFSAVNGKKVKITVNTNKGNCVSEKTLAEVPFEVVAGKVKNASISLTNDMRKIYAPGAYNNWELSTAQWLYNYDNGNLNKFEGIIDFGTTGAPVEFKITDKVNWYGTSDQDKDSVEQNDFNLNGGNNIDIYSKRYYCFHFYKDSQWFHYEFAYNNVAVFGINGDWDNGIEMTFDPKTQLFTADVNVTTAGAFKIRGKSDDNWDWNDANVWGAKMESGAIVPNDFAKPGENIPIAVGNYTIKANLVLWRYEIIAK